MGIVEDVVFWGVGRFVIFICIYMVKVGCDEEVFVFQFWIGVFEQFDDVVGIDSLVGEVFVVQFYFCFFVIFYGVEGFFIFFFDLVIYKIGVGFGCFYFIGQVKVFFVKVGKEELLGELQVVEFDQANGVFFFCQFMFFVYRVEDCKWVLFFWCIRQYEDEFVFYIKFIVVVCIGFFVYLVIIGKDSFGFGQFKVVSYYEEVVVLCVSFVVNNNSSYRWWCNGFKGYWLIIVFGVFYLFQAMGSV